VVLVAAALTVGPLRTLPLAAVLALATAACWLWLRSLDDELRRVHRPLPVEASLPPPAEVAIHPEVRALDEALDDLASRVARALPSGRISWAETVAPDLEELYAANVSHELRTPLNSILGFTHILLSEIDGELTPQQREDVEAIQSAAEPATPPEASIRTAVRTSSVLPRTRRL
jgi:signal transduction histidine kinase